MLARVAGQQGPHADVAEPVRFFEDHVEHRAKLTGISVDDGQHLSHSCLAFQRLPLFGDQPRVFHCDNGLISEGANQLDLPIGEWLYSLTGEDDDADHFVIP